MLLLLLLTVILVVQEQWGDYSRPIMAAVLPLRRELEQNHILAAPSSFPGGKKVQLFVRWADRAPRIDPKPLIWPHKSSWGFPDFDYFFGSVYFVLLFYLAILVLLYSLITSKEESWSSAHPIAPPLLVRRYFALEYDTNNALIIRRCVSHHTGYSSQRFKGNIAFIHWSFVYGCEGQY